MNVTNAFDQTPAAIVLAAGSSERFGAQKLLAILHGKPIIRHVVEAVISAGFQPVIVVTAPDSPVQPALGGLAVLVAVNHEAGSGIASSIRTGLLALHDEVSAALLVLGDQPFVQEDHLRQLAAVHHRDGFPITTSDYRGMAAPPVLFHRSVFHELLELEGDRGAKEILDRVPERVARIALDADFIDVDTPADLRKLEGG